MVVQRIVRRVRALPLVLAAAVILAGGSGCASADQPGTAAASGGGTTVTVFAAASLTGTFTELGQMFEAAHPGTSVTFSFGSSATLAQQIVQGAPADVFAAANPATMNTVTEAGLATEPVTFARNTLRIAVPADNPAKVDSLADLADPQVKVALCAEQVPCGAAAAKALKAAGVTVTPVTLEQDVKATVTKVELGEVDAALVYATDVIASAGRVRGIDFPEAATAVNDYPIATLSTAPAAGPARQFVDLVLSEQGQALLAKAGFATP